MIHGIDHVEFYVGNAYASAYFFTRALGFQRLAEAGLETGRRDRQSYAVAQGKIRLVFTSSLESGGPISGHTRVHGDSIRDVALRVDDADSAFQRCVAAGLEPVEAPHEISDEHGRVRRAAVRIFGDTVHSLVERDGYDGVFLPGFRDAHVRERRQGPAARGKNAADRSLSGADVFVEAQASLAAIDHVACCVEAGTLARWVDVYERALGLRSIHHEDIVTDHSAMNSKVVGTEDGSVKLPLMEPAQGRGRSQIEEYLDYHHGPGAQHLALLSSDIVHTVREMRDGGVDFLEIPGAYYETLDSRIGAIDEEIATLRDLNVLVDRDRWGYLLQVFTKPVTGRPTGFLEVVQRKGARGFGGNNVRSLFEAVERAQAARGNLER